MHELGLLLVQQVGSWLNIMSIKNCFLLFGGWFQNLILGKWQRFPITPEKKGKKKWTIGFQSSHAFHNGLNQHFDGITFV